MQQSTFSSKTNVCEGQTIRIIAEEPLKNGFAVSYLRTAGTWSPDYSLTREYPKVCVNLQTDVR